MACACVVGGDHVAKCKLCAKMFDVANTGGQALQSRGKHAELKTHRLKTAFRSLLGGQVLLVHWHLPVAGSGDDILKTD